MGANVEVRVARNRDVPIAAMLTLRHRSSVIYKYGCSNDKLHNLGGVPFLFWKLIEESKALGAGKIDFGRSDLDQESLINFKDKFGTSKRLLKYYRYPSTPEKKSRRWDRRGIRHVMSVLPDVVSATAGRILYRHMG
jgi:lipid II:glycine glycyltransferase (peptidoglycan interpeptide bridge formation enzyme)